MKKSQTLASLCLALAVCLAAAAAAGGEAGDPLISLSYLEGAFSQSLEAAAGAPAAAVVATGGRAPALYRLCRREIKYDHDLLVKGLYHLYRKNARR